MIFTGHFLMTITSFQKSEHGLYVCLNSFFGFGKKYVECYSNKTGRKLFLHMKQVKKPPKEAEEESGIPEKVSKMAIGVEGGFKSDVKKDEYDDVNEIVMLPSFQKFSIGKQRFFFHKAKGQLISKRPFGVFKYT